MHPNNYVMKCCHEWLDLDEESDSNCNIVTLWCLIFLTQGMKTDVRFYIYVLVTLHGLLTTSIEQAKSWWH